MLRVRKGKRKKIGMLKIVVFRNNLRVHDNRVIRTALKNVSKPFLLVGFYCFDKDHFSTLTSFGFPKTGALIVF